MGMILFQIWIMSFLFYQVDIIGSLSIDNMMVPLLVLAWVFLGDRNNVKANKARLKMMSFTAVVFMLLILIEFAKLQSLSDMQGFKLSVTEHLKHFGYILIPLLYISNEKYLKWSIFSLMVVIGINSLLAVLGAVGVIPSFGSTEGLSRIPGLIRARGPLVNDGDTALLIAFTSLMVWSVKEHRISFIPESSLLRYVILLLLFAGVVATQSRNVILTVAMTFVVYYWLKIMLRGSRGGMQTIMSVLGIVVFLVSVTFVALNADTLVAWVTNMFGMSGEGTVRDRLASYSVALQMLEKSRWFGLNANEMAVNALFIAKLHNMWLGVALFSGVVGVILVLSLVLVGLINALRLVKNPDWKEYGLILASFVLVSLWFSPNFYPGHNAFIFWFCIGMALTAGQTFYFTRQESIVIHDRQPGAQNPEQTAVKNPRILRYRANRQT